jgi:hypothetical protein
MIGGEGETIVTFTGTHGEATVTPTCVRGPSLLPSALAMAAMRQSTASPVIPALSNRWILTQTLRLEAGFRPGKRPVGTRGRAAKLSLTLKGQ